MFSLYQVPRVLEDQVVSLSCVEAPGVQVPHQQLIDHDPGRIVHDDGRPGRVRSSLRPRVSEPERRGRSGRHRSASLSGLA